jgi:hypothetical protein
MQTTEHKTDGQEALFQEALKAAQKRQKFYKLCCERITARPVRAYYVGEHKIIWLGKDVKGEYFEGVNKNGFTFCITRHPGQADYSYGCGKCSVDMFGADHYNDSFEAGTLTEAVGKAMNYGEELM